MNRQSTMTTTSMEGDAVGYAHESVSRQRGSGPARREPRFSHHGKLMAEVAGARFLLGAVGPTGVQSCVSPDPDFPASRSSSTEAVLQGRDTAAGRVELVGRASLARRPDGDAERQHDEHEKPRDRDGVGLPQSRAHRRMPRIALS